MSLIKLTEGTSKQIETNCETNELSANTSVEEQFNNIQTIITKLTTLIKNTGLDNETGNNHSNHTNKNNNQNKNRIDDNEDATQMITHNKRKSSNSFN